MWWLILTVYLFRLRNAKEIPKARGARNKQNGLWPKEWFNSWMDLKSEQATEMQWNYRRWGLVGKVDLSLEDVCLPSSPPIWASLCSLSTMSWIASSLPLASTITMMFSLKLGLERMQLTMIDKASETVSSDQPFLLRSGIWSWRQAKQWMQWNSIDGVEKVRGGGWRAEGIVQLTV